MPSLFPGGNDNHPETLPLPPFQRLGQRDSMNEPLPSLPASPEPTEEDLATGKLWQDGDSDDDQRSQKNMIPKVEHHHKRSSGRNKRKGKARAFSSVGIPEVDLEAGVVGDGDDETTPQTSGPSSYPPTNEELDESRRVEEVCAIFQGTPLY